MHRADIQPVNLKAASGAGSPWTSQCCKRAWGAPSSFLFCYRSCLFFFFFSFCLFFFLDILLSPKRRLSKLGGAGSFSLPSPASPPQALVSFIIIIFLKRFLCLFAPGRVWKAHSHTNWSSIKREHFVLRETNSSATGRTQAGFLTRTLHFRFQVELDSPQGPSAMFLHSIIPRSYPQFT